jgi:hypothetical protein
MKKRDVSIASDYTGKSITALVCRCISYLRKETSSTKIAHTMNPIHATNLIVCLRSNKKDFEMESNQETGWDAREGYMRELVLRARMVLNSDNRNLKDWLEKMRDFFDWACLSLDEEEYITFKQKVLHIESLINAKGENINGSIRMFTARERKQREMKAYEELRDFFQQLNRLLWSKGIYVPIKEKQDKNKAINRTR